MGEIKVSPYATFAIQALYIMKYSEVMKYSVRDFTVFVRSQALYL